MKNTAVVSWGCGLPTGHAPRLAQQLNCKYYQLPSPIIPHEKNIIFVGGFFGDLAKLQELYNYGDYNLFLILVGTDILELIGRNIKDPVFELLNKVKLITVSKQLKQELKSLNLKSEIITLVPNKTELLNLHTNRTGILFYCPPNKFKIDLFYAKEIVKVAGALPTFSFYCYGGAQIDTGLSNWHNLGFVTGEEKKELYKKIKYNVRVAKHDGFPQSIIELARLGIPTITNHNFPHIIQITDTDDIIKQVKNKIQESNIDIVAMKKYYTDNFTVEQVIKSVEELII